MEFRQRDGTIVELGHLEQVKFSPPGEVLLELRAGALVLDIETVDRIAALPRCAHCGSLIDPRSSRCTDGCND